MAYAPKRIKRVVTRGGILCVLIFFACVALYPLVFLFLNTFKTSTQYLQSPLSWPQSFGYLENFTAMFARFDVGQIFLNTVTYIVLAALLSLSVSVPAAFALARLKFPLKRLFFLVIVISMTIPSITFIIPDYLMLSDYGLIDSLWAVVLLWVATSIPGSVFLLTTYMRSLPKEIIEATRVDGANYWQMMGRIVLPMSVPGIVTITIFNVTGWWNDLLIPLLFLQSDEKKTVTVAVATIVSRYSTDYPLLLTGLFMASLPPILIYVFIQRYIRKGLVLGAVK